MPKAQDTFFETGSSAKTKALLQSVGSENLLHSNLKVVTQKLFKVLTDKNENKQAINTTKPVYDRQVQQDDEIATMEQLELCANAARKNEGYDQFD